LVAKLTAAGFSPAQSVSAAIQPMPLSQSSSP
jgi:hypothetical protein